jgi:hypothetical protein
MSLKKEKKVNYTVRLPEKDIEKAQELELDIPGICRWALKKAISNIKKKYATSE